MENALYEHFLADGEYGAAGMCEEPDRSLFYKNALGIRRYYEHCVLPEYKETLLYPSGGKPNTMLVYPNYMRAMRTQYTQFVEKYKEDGERFCAEFEQKYEHVPIQHQVGGCMWTHSFPHYERVLKEGFLSYQARIDKIEDKDMKEGLTHVLKGIACYVQRCVDYLKSVQADEKLISALERVPMHPARDIYEAVVCWNFVLYLDGCDNLGCVDSGLLPYHKGENIVPLLQNLYDNLDVNNGYSMALKAPYNDLTLQCLEASKGKRRPMIELFVNKETPERVWEKAFEVIRTQNGQPAFYNGDIFLKELQKKLPEISDADLGQFCGGGCTESMIAGYSNVGSLDAGINLGILLEETLYQSLENAKDFEEFYNCFIQRVQQTADVVTDSISLSQKERAEVCPLPMRTLLVDDCIDKGVDFNNGGARYKWSIINFAGMINVIDSMLVVKDLVFEQKKYTPQQLLSYLKANDEAFLAEARNHDVCFGLDLEEVNAFSNRISTDIFATLEGKKPYFGSAFLSSCIQFNAQVPAGKRVGATPDGRASKMPLCDSLVAIFGKDKKGPTALLKSVTSLNLKKAVGTPVVGFNIAPNVKDDVLKGLILTYMQLGGMQMQITCISREMLEDAYQNPEMHKNLVVRVGGYSEYFYVLSDELKRMIINRTIQENI